MADIDVTVNGHSYRVACEDGEEAHLMSIADHLNSHATRLANELGQVGETRMMLMAGLLVGDELSDALDRVEELEKESSTAQSEKGASADAIAAATRRIAGIAARIKSA
jgi:cell division protein ZapA